MALLFSERGKVFKVHMPWYMHQKIMHNTSDSKRFQKEQNYEWTASIYSQGKIKIYIIDIYYIELSRINNIISSTVLSNYNSIICTINENW